MSVVRRYRKTMQFSERNLAQLSPLKCSFSACHSPSDSAEILVVKFEGECGIGSGSNRDAAFMAALAMAGVEAWCAPAVIFDLRELRYEWGDELTRLFSVKPQTFHPEYVFDQILSPTLESYEYPIAIVVSDLNRKGLTSLVAQELRKRPEDFLFDTLESAVVSVGVRLDRQHPRAQPGAPPNGGPAELWRFGSRWRAAIGELAVGPVSHEQATHHSGFSGFGRPFRRRRLCPVLRRRTAPCRVPDVCERRHVYLPGRARLGKRPRRFHAHQFHLHERRDKRAEDFILRPSAAHTHRELGRIYSSEPHLRDSYPRDAS